MRPRRINYLQHCIQGRQALAILLDCWAEDRTLPVVLITAPGESAFAARNIRVAMSKEKSKVKSPAEYGFTLSEPFTYTDEHQITGEAIVIRWRITPTQHLKNIWDKITPDMPILTRS